MGKRSPSFSRISRLMVLSLIATLVACGGGGGGGSLIGPAASTRGGSQGSTAEEPAVEAVTISGVATFDLVKHKADFVGLDYQNVQRAPVRGATVRLLNRAGETLDSAVTDDTGAYFLEAPAETAVRVRVEARMEQTGSPSWAFAVHDNTRGNALYALDGELTDSGTVDTIRDLHALSGWNGSGYSPDRRIAAPFAILDTLHAAVDEVVAVDADVQLPEMQVFWSGDNIPVDGDLSNGEIGTSFYTSSGPSIYLLGYANNDTDEYDRSVISHEFAHYLEDQLSRTESVGGLHWGDSRLDMRVALSEGWGNAFAAIATGDSLYWDSDGVRQSESSTFDVASNETGNRGWFSESSVQTMLFSLFDQNGGFGPIYRALTSPQFLEFDGASSIYTLVEALRGLAEVDEQAIGELLMQERISGVGGYGENEENAGGSLIALPHYRKLSVGQTVDVCSDQQHLDSNGQEHLHSNGLEVRRFIRFEIPVSGSYSISVQQQGGLTAADPDFVLWQRDASLAFADSESPAGVEELRMELPVGQYWLEVYDYSNADKLDSTGGLKCFTVSLEVAP